MDCIDAIAVLTGRDVLFVIVALMIAHIMPTIQARIPPTMVRVRMQ